MESFVVLNNGVKMPMVGLGTFQTKSNVHEVIDAALGSGYRLIDTAAVYNNEKLISSCLPELLRKHGLKREDVFITTKLAPKDLSSDLVKEALDASLNNLSLEFVDLYLIHWPGRQGVKSESSENKRFRAETWNKMEEIYLKSGKVKSIGVSNHLTRHLEEMKEYWRVVPAIVQNEFHPDYKDYDVIEFCNDNGIHFQSYSSLGQCRLVKDPRFIEIANNYNKSPSQLLLKWALQQNVSIIPKSTRREHIVENSQLFDFEISASDMQVMNGMGRDCKYAWDPSHVA